MTEVQMGRTETEHFGFASCLAIPGSLQRNRHRSRIRVNYKTALLTEALSRGQKDAFLRSFPVGMSQSQLDFVDIPVETDIPLFVDPYAMHISSQDWLRECGNAVVDYFQTLIEAIKADKTKAVMQLLDNFHEPNETHLGLSPGRPSGRGWGPKKAKELYEILKRSDAVRSGDLKDLGDYEMFVPGIGPDKISTSPPISLKMNF